MTVKLNAAQWVEVTYELEEGVVLLFLVRPVSDPNGNSYWLGNDIMDDLNYEALVRISDAVYAALKE